MTMAEVVLDSVSPKGIRLTTLKLVYPRFIHAEFMTHRVFSRNASSSRAQPTASLLSQVESKPVIPTYWGKNQPGMQASEEVDDETKEEAEAAWKSAATTAVIHAKMLAELGVHKQITNRLLEPFLPITVLVTATEWQNFFDLRMHKAAQPEIHLLATHMHLAMKYSVPKELEYGEWHLPFVRAEERDEHSAQTLLEVSTARCARVSYLKHDSTKPTVEEDISLYERLVGSVPIHASPCEHQATPMVEKDTFYKNFRGWMQHRELVELAMLKNSIDSATQL